MRLHRRIGEALEAHRDANPAELAYHFARGAGATKAVAYALAAAEQAAAALAYEEAAEHYRRALVEPRLDILLALGAAELRAGDPTARETFAAAAAARPRARRPRRAGRGRARLRRPPRRGGRRSTTTASRCSRRRSARFGAEDIRSRVQLRARAGRPAPVRAGRGAPLALSAEALAMAQRLGDPRALLVALESRHAALLHVDHLDERLRLSEELLGLAARIGERELEALGHHWRIYDLLEAGRVEDARTRAPQAGDARRRAAPAALQPLRGRLGGRVGADGGPRRRRRAARARGLRARRARRRRATPRRSSPPRT